MIVEWFTPSPKPALEWFGLLSGTIASMGGGSTSAIASVVGAPGAGPAGADGADGVDGVDGADGADGADSTVAGPAGAGVPVGGTAGQVLAKIDATNFNTEWVAAGGGGASVFSFCQVRNTDTTTNINGTTAANIPFGGTNDATDADYTLASDSITVNFDGTVNVQAHIAQTSSSLRSSVGIWITKNGTKVSGVGQSGYIRDISSHTRSSSHMTATFTVADGDVIRVQGEQRGSPFGPVTQIAGESQVTVERRT